MHVRKVIKSSYCTNNNAYSRKREKQNTTDEKIMIKYVNLRASRTVVHCAVIQPKQQQTVDGIHYESISIKHNQRISTKQHLRRSVAAAFFLFCSFVMRFNSYMPSVLLCTVAYINSILFC